jgi:16S rRNA (uracil1498-N3)-methyltransferase
VGNKTKLTDSLWYDNPGFVHQLGKVLRAKLGDKVVLFDGVSLDRMYKIAEITPHAVHLKHVTDMARKIPNKNIYLLWSLLKKDKNDWVLQKSTELGVRHFIPIITERTEKMGFDIERAVKIVIEAAEQCGRSDIPTIREPIHITKAIEELKNKVHLFYCEQDSKIPNTSHDIPDSVGVLVGPEGGWTETELQTFEATHVAPLNLHDFTLRAETACITAVAKLVQ